MVRRRRLDRARAPGRARAAAAARGSSGLRCHAVRVGPRPSRQPRRAARGRAGGLPVRHTDARRVCSRLRPGVHALPAPSRPVGAYAGQTTGYGAVRPAGFGPPPQPRRSHTGRIVAGVAVLAVVVVGAALIAPRVLPRLAHHSLAGTAPQQPWQARRSTPRRWPGPSCCSSSRRCSRRSPTCPTGPCSSRSSTGRRPRARRANGCWPSRGASRETFDQDNAASELIAGMESTAGVGDVAHGGTDDGGSYGCLSPARYNGAIVACMWARSGTGFIAVYDVGAAAWARTQQHLLDAVRDLLGEPPQQVRSAVAAGLPGDVAHRQVGVTGEDEQQIREPVEVGGGQRFMVSPCTSSAAHVERSARRTMVRATWSRALPGVPPGSTNERSGDSAALYSSQAASSAVDVGLLDAKRWELRVHDHRRAEVGADVEELVLHAGQERGDVVAADHRGPARRRARSSPRRCRRRPAAAGRSCSPGQVAERGRAVVAGARVDPSEVDHIGEPTASP